MELADDLVLDERQCRNFYSSRNHMPSGSKIIVTSRSENIIKLGTTGAVKLDLLSLEAYWFFFEAPKLATRGGGVNGSRSKFLRNLNRRPISQNHRKPSNMGCGSRERVEGIPQLIGL